MDPATLTLVMGLISQGPAMIKFATDTYAMFTNDKITADELQQMWVAAGNAVKEAEAKWKAAGGGSA